MELPGEEHPEPVFLTSRQVASPSMHNKRGKKEENTGERKRGKSWERSTSDLNDGPP